jgi:hypothetical protein
MGIVYLLRHREACLFEVGIAAALFVQFLCILSYFLLAQRYAADLYPFLIFCLVVFLVSRKAGSSQLRYTIVALIAFSVVLNSLATVSWLVDADLNVPAKTRGAWEKVIGRLSYERWK